jgi:hypothetical protein
VVLAAKPALLSAQVEAARALADRGASEDPRFLEEAIAGTQRQGPGGPQIWGWGRIGQVSARRTELEDTFFESRYELARIRLALARGGRDEAEKSRQLRLAKSDILVMARLRPSLASSPWREKLDQVMKDIQGELGERRTGIPLSGPKPTGSNS